MDGGELHAGRDFLPCACDGATSLLPHMILVELLHFLLFSSIIHLLLDTIPDLWQCVLIHRKVPAATHLAVNMHFNKLTD